MKKNLKRYTVYGNKTAYSNGYKEHSNGKWVKFDDVKELLNSSTNNNKQYKPALDRLIDLRYQCEDDLSGAACEELDKIIKCLNA